MLMRRAGRDPNNPAPGIRRHGAGWQSTAKVRGERVYEQWPLDTPLSEILEWQKDARAQLRITQPAVQAGTLQADVARYLKLASVQAMPTFGERQQHLEEWCAYFARRRRRSIRPLELEERRDELLRVLAPASVNKRLRALSNVWTKLDGRRAPNPVREVTECEETSAAPRAIPYDIIDAILAEMPETAIGVRKDGTRTAGKPRKNDAKIICTIYAYTGLAPEQLKTLERPCVDLEAATLLLVPRRKGKKPRAAGGRGLAQLVPLLPTAVEAFRQFDARQLWGVRFSNSTVHRSFTSAAARLGFDGLTPYDLRHSFLTALYQETRDLRVTGVFGGHRSEATTKRYTIAAVAPQLQEAVDKLRARLASTTDVQRAGENG